MMRKLVLRSFILAILSAGCMSLYSCGPEEIDPKKDEQKNNHTFYKKVDPGTDVNGG